MTVETGMRGWNAAIVSAIMGVVVGLVVGIGITSLSAGAADDRSDAFTGRGAGLVASRLFEAPADDSPAATGRGAGLVPGRLFEAPADE